MKLRRQWALILAGLTLCLVLVSQGIRQWQLAPAIAQEELEQVDPEEAPEDAPAEDLDAAPDAAEPEPTEPEAAEPESEEAAESFALGGSYDDPQGRYQIAILNGFSVNTYAGSPVFEAGDGRLAYTVVTVPIAPDSDEPVGTVTDATLAQVARDTFGDGEGFQTTGFQQLDEGGIQISWLGSLSQGGSTQGMQGVILSRQANNQIYLLALAATPEGYDQIESAIATLAPTLELL
jgi:hypothetical protein